MLRVPGTLIVVSLLLGAGAPVAIADTAAALKALDPDNDGTIDLAEAQAGGKKKFAKLNPDNDGTLDAKELTGILDEAAIKAADPDSDGTLDEKEYAEVVEAKFKAANPDDDGTVDERSSAPRPVSSF